MRLPAVNLLIGLAKGADVTLHLLDEPEGHARLIPPRAGADGAFHTELGQGAVAVCDIGIVHRNWPRLKVLRLIQASGYRGIGPAYGQAGSHP